MSMTRYNKRDAQLADDWKWLRDTEQGQRIIADLMVWCNAYTPIETKDPIELARLVGEQNVAKRVAYYLGWHISPSDYARHAEDDADLLNRMLESTH